VRRRSFPKLSEWGQKWWTASKLHMEKVYRNLIDSTAAAIIPYRLCLDCYLKENVPSLVISILI
jgi:hypothetical protein